MAPNFSIVIFIFSGNLKKMVLWFMKSFLASQSLLSLGQLKVSNRVYNVDIVFIIINATQAVFHWYFYVLS